MIPKDVIHPYLYIYNDIGQTPVELEVLISCYMTTEKTDRKKAIEVYEKELDNYKMTLVSGVAVVTLHNYTNNVYRLFSRNFRKDRCMSQTKGSNNILRCRASAKIDKWCKQHATLHSMPIKEEVKIPAKPKTQYGSLQAIQSETDIGKLKLICSILATNHPAVLQECLLSAKKHHNDKMVLNEISKLEQNKSLIDHKIDKLKEKLK